VKKSMQRWKRSADDVDDQEGQLTERTDNKGRTCQDCKHDLETAVKTAASRSHRGGGGKISLVQGRWYLSKNVASQGNA
jgi:hypothetical protein